MLLDGLNFVCIIKGGPSFVCIIKGGRLSKSLRTPVLAKNIVTALAHKKNKY